ncbi:MAG: hypothetical protein HRT44_08740 [Bdellovibrionales bacterium]|nr:hypothetical protein [Bdellovibrionales bacterium]
MNLPLADTRPFFDTCPRCGGRGLEKLRTYSHCVECNYFEAPQAGSIESLLVSLNHEAEAIGLFDQQSQPDQQELEDNDAA